MVHPIYTIEEFIKDIKEPFKSEEMTLENTANYIMKTYNGIIYNRYDEVKGIYKRRIERASKKDKIRLTKKFENLKREDSFTIQIELHAFDRLSIDIFPKTGLMVIINRIMSGISAIERLNFTPYPLEGTLFLFDPNDIGPFTYFDNSSSYIENRILEGVWIKDNKLTFLKQVIIDKKTLQS